ncbi:MAG: T9SS type A sorting domain-containing protein [Flavobacteriales bacterium]|nr:T9SS type A sorting domain-containing protein [Flavobacteriales bacterium]
MKKILLAMAVVFAAFTTNAQLPNGSIAPDFTGTDINGVEWNLYDLLDQGYRVVIDFSATWCGPCWSYHTSGALEGLYEEYGPDGTNEVMVFFLEGDDATTADDLAGTGGNTQGDWIEGTSYPIIDNAQDIFNLYQCGYYPTIYTVCPSRIVTETSQISTADHYAFIQQNACSPATESNDPSLVSYAGVHATCSAVDVLVNLQNFGLDNLTACTIAVTGGDNNISFNWMGNLDTYEMTEVNVGSVNISSDATLTVSITSSNDTEDNDEVMADISMAEEGTTHIHIDFKTDNWPAETDWQLLDDDGNVVESESYGNSDNTEEFSYDFWVAQGCYSFRITDEFGDGLNASYWGDYEDGYCHVYSVDEGGNIVAEIYDYDGSYWYADESAAANASQVVGISENEMAEVLNAYPNPTSDVITFNYNIKEAGNVSFEVIDMVGAKVLVQNIGSKAMGNHTTALNLDHLASGVYMVNINTGGSVSTLRVNVQ